MRASLRVSQNSKAKQKQRWWWLRRRGVSVGFGRLARRRQQSRWLSVVLRYCLGLCRADPVPAIVGPAQAPGSRITWSLTAL